MSLTRAILERLRTRLGPSVHWTIADFTDLAPMAPVLSNNTTQTVPNGVDLYAAFWELVRAGIIVPGHRNLGRLETGNDHFRDFPQFAITSFGHDVIARGADDFEPHDAAEYVIRLQNRVPSLTTTIVRYVSEALATFNSQHYLGCAVLLGVGSEALLENLYDAICAHLLPAAQAKFRSKMGEKRWAKARFEYAVSQVHHEELPQEFSDRVKTHLEMLAEIIKLSRDDAGHARAQRIDREIAYMNLIAFPVLAGVVAELIQRFAEPCVRSES